MRKNGFDRIAWIYDPLATAVFGKAMADSQVTFFEEVPPGSRILMLGGGTGRVLVKLFKDCPGCHVTFIDASLEMTKKAQSRLSGSDKVTFIHGTESDIPNGSVYDVVVTNFYLDLFPDGHLGSVLAAIVSHVKHGGTWIVTDFVEGKVLWQRLLLKLMYLFFRIVAQIPATSLPDWESALGTAGLTKKNSRLFFKSFIQSSCWIKNS